MQEIIFSQVCKKQEREESVCVCMCGKEGERTDGGRKRGRNKEGRREEVGTHSQVHTDT